MYKMEIRKIKWKLNKLTRAGRKCGPGCAASQCTSGSTAHSITSCRCRPSWTAASAARGASRGTAVRGPAGTGSRPPATCGCSPPPAGGACRLAGRAGVRRDGVRRGSKKCLVALPLVKSTPKSISWVLRFRKIIWVS